VENVFGVGTTLNSISNISKLVVGTNSHYVTLDYTAGTVLSATGTANAWMTLAGGGKSVGTVQNSGSVPALIVNQASSNLLAPANVFTFNFAVDQQGQLTNQMKQIAQRAFQWCRGQAHRVEMDLKYYTGTTNAQDFTILSVTGWVFNASGTNTVYITIPTNNIMTGDKLYWVMYTFPWDATNAYVSSDGFYSSLDDGSNGVFTSLAGIGLQILGITDTAYAGRDWDKWIAYNTRTQQLVMTYGIKDKGLILDQFNFDGGNYTGWNVVANPNITWTVTNGALRATVVSTGGYAYITRNGLALNNTNITIEYDTRFMNNARDGGIVYRGRVLDVNPNRCGWEDNNPTFYKCTNMVTGAWIHVTVNIRDGVPYPRSDLYVDNSPIYSNSAVVFRDEPVESTNWTTNTVGFLSPYSNVNSYVEWDNFRIVDEQYATVWDLVSGISFPSNGFPTATWPSIPDYDPHMLEHSGTLGGAGYEWYIYFRGTNMSGTKSVNVYFAPRLVVESGSFPTNFYRGSTLQIPIQWDNLGTNLPSKLDLEIQEPYIGTNFGKAVFDITNASGSGVYSITVSNNAPAGSNYVWVAYIYPPFATNAMLQRIGLDDTFRFTPEPFGAPVNPETRITVNAKNDIFVDAGIPLGCSIYTWTGDPSSNTVFNGAYTGVAGIPEGTQCFYTVSDSWAGWGVFNTSGGANMSSYSNGYVKFWVKSTQQLKVGLEGPAGYQNNIYVPSTTNLWKQYSLSMTNFPTVTLTNMYGLFEITSDGATTNYVDWVSWSSSP